MSATTILVVLGGLTSSSDARAHHWVAWCNVSRSRLINHGSSLCYSRCAGYARESEFELMVSIC